LNLKRLVLDPNALVSGIVGPGSDKPPRLLVDAIENLDFEVVVCPRLLGEVRKALRKPYFRERLSAEEARQALRRIDAVAIAFDDPKDVAPTLRDPEDDYLLALARVAEAEAVVSGDKDLLDHAEKLEPRAISPRAACELLGLSRGA
jgi:putative PIN family toxin of toxin-antitoxin system